MHKLYKKHLLIIRDAKMLQQINQNRVLLRVFIEKKKRPENSKVFGLSCCIAFKNSIIWKRVTLFVQTQRIGKSIICLSAGQCTARALSLDAQG